MIYIKYFKVEVDLCESFVFKYFNKVLKYIYIYRKYR